MNRIAIGRWRDDADGPMQVVSGTLGRAITSAQGMLDAVLIKARFWQRWSGTPLKERQPKPLNRLRDGFKGKLTSSKWAAIAEHSPDTALRDIRQLLELGVLKKSSGGGAARATRWQIDSAVPNEKGRGQRRALPRPAFALCSDQRMMS